MIKEKVAKLIDIKSIITLLLVSLLVFVVVFCLITGKSLVDPMFMLFSNTLTMVITYYFNHEKKENK